MPGRVINPPLQLPSTRCLTFTYFLRMQDTYFRYIGTAIVIYRWYICISKSYTLIYDTNNYVEN